MQAMNDELSDLKRKYEEVSGEPFEDEVDVSEGGKKRNPVTSKSPMG